MGRRLRFLPDNDDGVLVEVSCRTIRALALLRPSRRMREITVGVLGRAREVSPVEVCAFSCLSNHYHGLLVVRDQQELTRFMHHFQGNLAREVGRHVRWHGPVWSRRYDGMVVTDEPEAQWARLKYVLSNSVKEGLVESPLEWQGAHAAGALVHGEPMEGYWWNRTKEWAAARRGETYGTYDYATRYLVELAPLPCFRHLSAEEYQNRVAELIREIEEEGREARGDRPVLGVEAVARQDPFEPPTYQTKKSPRRQFHGTSKEHLRDLREEFAIFVAKFETASEELRSGNLEAASWFPEGSYPPALPFIGEKPPPRPPAPPTPRRTTTASGRVEVGEVPVVMIPARSRDSPPRIRGHPS
jgi:REP element-mobilizing transposase RayT